jgi:transposase InsO family protein
VALERAKAEKEAHGEFESEHPDYRGAQDTFYVGNLKGVGRIYQQTFIDTYTKVAFAKLYDRKTPITAADLRNDRVVPFFDSQDVKLLRVLTDGAANIAAIPNGTSMNSILAVEDIDHSRTKTKSPQTNGICERFHKTVLNEFYHVAFSQKGVSFNRQAADRSSMSGSANTMRRGHIRDAGASAKRRCRPSWMQCQ